MNKIFKILALTVCILSGYISYAQSSLTVRGTVKDSEGFPVAGAAVMLEGYQSTGVVTDIDGNYTLTIPAKAVAKAVLNVSCLSYETQTKAVNGKSKIDFSLKDDAEVLDEVVVVGYGSLRRSDLTGSVTSVKIDDADAGRASSLDQLLKGKAAGVSVISNSAGPDAGLSIRVRGTTSLNSSNEPLYVIDGVIMTMPGNASFSKGDAVEDVNPLMGINPQDIASMEILKDASATAIYGSAGANGVVLITTKTANRDRPTISFNAGVDISQQYKQIEMLDFDEYLMYIKDQYMAYNKMEINDLQESDYKNLYGNLFEDPVNLQGLKVSPVNWQDFIMRTAIGQRYYLSIAGRPKTLSYSFSVGYNNKQGIVKNTGAEQFTMRLNATKQLFKKFSIGTKTNFAYINSSMTQGMSTTTLDGGSSMMRSMLISRPYTHNGNIIDDDAEWDSGTLRATPAKWLSDFQSLRKEYRITPHIFADWKILPWMEFKTSFGGDFRVRERTRWKGQTVNYGAEGSIAAMSSQNVYRWNWDTTLNFNKKFKKHSINGTLGMTMGRYFAATSSVEAWMIPEYKVQHLAINTGQDMKVGYGESAVSEMSYFARALYNYADRYLLTATVRVDGSSKFSKENRFSVFPSLAAAWRLSEEPWMKEIKWLSMAKLRAGWGRVGNSAVSAYQIYSTFGTAVYPDHTEGNEASGIVPGIAPSNIANPALKWETTEQWNLGLDLGFWDGRLAFTLDLYDKYTYDLLQKKALSTSSGFSEMWLNDGAIRNRGLELSVDATPISIGDFEWNVAGQISFNRNTIENIGAQGGSGKLWLSHTDKEQTDCYYYKGNNIGNSNYLHTYANIFIEGQPVGLFYGYKSDGIVQEGERGVPLTPPSEGNDTSREPGSVQYLDLNGNGFLDEEDKTIIGDPNPDFIYGFSTSFTWKDLTLSASFNGSYGNDILNANLTQETDVAYNGNIFNYWNIRREAYYNAWTPENRNNKYQALGFSQSDNFERRAMTDRRIEDGSYLRLSNLSISYKLPIPKNKVFRNITVGVSGSNLYVWTKYSGWDPEVSSNGNDMKKVGIDNGSYPSARTYSFDLKFTF